MNDYLNLGGTTTMQDALLAKLREAGITLAPTFDGAFQREGSQWFKGQVLTVGDQTIHWACYGDFARNISEQWHSARALTSEQQEVVNKAVLLANKENRHARESHWELVSKAVQAEWEDFHDIGTTPYMERKGIKELYGCRVEASEHGARLIVPARDADSTLWGYQRIYSEKLSQTGTDKIFRKGARKEGCYHLLGKIEAGKTIFIAEGISTAIAIYEALSRNQPVCSSFDAGNVVHVAQALRKAFPENHFVFCADNDKFPSKDGKIYYTGFKKAEYAQRKVGNARIVVPKFTLEEDQGKPTDFDDLAKLRGLEEVKRQVLEEPVHVQEGEDALHPIESYNKKGEATKPAESIVAINLLRWYGDNLLVQGKEVFIYDEGYWQHQNENGVTNIKQQLSLLYGLKATARDIDGAYKYFLMQATRVEGARNMFVPAPFMANFTNGTLHLIQRPGLKPDLVFREHARGDYMTTQLPFEFPGLHTLTATNPKFEAMLERVFKGDADSDSKRRVLAQMFGAVIMPCFPKIFFLVGKKGSGKSTVCKLLNRLIDDQNVSRVDPSAFREFHMATMAGKLLNMDTDIDLHKPINDSVIKKVIDRIPFRIARKFQDDILAPLPPIHVYGGNDLPKSYEGATGAFERRVVIVRFGAFSAEAQGTGYDLDFDTVVWEAGWQGILAFALRGLVDLVEAKGHFHVPQSSKDALGEWDARSDVLAQFLDALEHKELDAKDTYLVGDGTEISRKALWDLFSTWQEKSGARGRLASQKDLCNMMRNKGFDEKIVRGTRIWLGVGMIPDAESSV